MADPNLFGVVPKARKARPAPSPTGEIQRLIGLWASLFEERFHEKPIVTGKDGAAVKRLVAHGGVGAVERRLRIYLALDDPYIAGQGYPLSLMLGAWNRLVAQDVQAPSRVPDSDATSRYLRGIKGAGR